MTGISCRAWSLSLVVHLVLLALLSLYTLDKGVAVSDEPIHVRMWESPRARPQVRVQRWRHGDAHPDLSSSVVPPPVRAMSIVALNPHPVAANVAPWYTISTPPRENGLVVPTAMGYTGSSQNTTALRPIRPEIVPVKSFVRRPSELAALSATVQNLELPHNPLERIAMDAIYTRGGDRLDLLFLIDASQSMENNIRAINRYLDGMMSRLSESDLDVRLGVVAFRHSTFFSLMGWNAQVQPLTHDFGRVKRMLADIECVGGERALDAILIALKRIKFRPSAEKRLILLTDEYVSGEATRAAVLKEVGKSDIRVDVIGRDEPFQRRLASLSNGLWQSILDIH